MVEQTLTHVEGAGGAVLIHRIHDSLCRIRARRHMTWVFAPPGSGKSTHVAAHLGALAVARIWYRFEAGDGPLSLVDFLEASLQCKFPGLGPRQPEGPDGPPAAALALRLRLQQALERQPDGFTLVLDDIDHLVPSARELLLDALCSVMPRRLHLMVLGCSRPPAPVERLVMHGDMGLVDWSVLRLLDDEMDRVGQRLGWAEVGEPEWLRLLGGWPGGIALMCGAGGAGDPTTQGATRARGMRLMLDYLSAQTLDRMDASDRALLLHLGWMEEVGPEDVMALCPGDWSQWGRLTELSRQCLFIQEAAGDPARLRFHPAFHAMLQTAAMLRLAPAELAALQGRSAARLEAGGWIDQAAELHIRASDEAALAALMQRVAANTRAGSLPPRWSRWLDHLSAQTLQSHPWLRYCQGRLQSARDPRAAHDALTEAAVAFRDLQDESGEVHAICALVELDLASVLHHGELRACAGRLRDHLDANGVLGESSERLIASACAAAALAHSDAQAGPVAELAREALRQLGACTEPAQRLRVATRLLDCWPWLPEGVPQAMVVEFDALATTDFVPQLWRLDWCCASARWQLDHGGDLAACRAQLDQVPRIAQACGDARFTDLATILRAELLLAEGRAQEAAETFRVFALRWAGEPVPPVWRAAVLKLRLLFARGDPSSGLALAQLLLPRVSGPGQEWQGVEFALTLAAHCAASGAHAQAESWCTRAQGLAFGPLVTRVAHQRSLLKACALDTRGDLRAAHALLAHGLAAHRRAGGGLFVCTPGLAARVVQMALDAGVEAPHGLAVITRQELQPVSRASAAWPWPLAVRIFGALSVSIRAEPVKWQGKAQQKLLDLLQILCIAGTAGRSQNFLETHLWPESDNPRAALTVAVHRLRKMLGHDQAVRVHAGLVSIDTDLVWTDLQAFDELCERIVTQRASLADSSLQTMAATLLDLYRAGLPAQSGDGWYLAVRQRLNTRFIAAAGMLGERLEEEEQWGAAGRLYQRVLDVEPLCEAAFRGLMRCAHAQGDSGAAFGFYRFCRDSLSSALNAEPSDETRRLAISMGLARLPTQGSSLS